MLVISEECKCQLRQTEDEHVLWLRRIDAVGRLPELGVSKAVRHYAVGYRRMAPATDEYKMRELRGQQGQEVWSWKSGSGDQCAGLSTSDMHLLLKPFLHTD